MESKNELQAANATKLLGLFHNNHMLYDLDWDKTEEASVAEMTSKALDILQKNDDGFFLMVEGGRIDHATHDNSPLLPFRKQLHLIKQ